MDENYQMVGQEEEVLEEEIVGEEQYEEYVEIGDDEAYTGDRLALEDGRIVTPARQYAQYMQQMQRVQPQTRYGQAPRLQQGQRPMGSQGVYSYESPGTQRQLSPQRYAYMPESEEMKPQVLRQSNQMFYTPNTSFGVRKAITPGPSREALTTPYMGMVKPPKPIKKSIGKRKPCNCTKSLCLKLYCECFANGEFCMDCNCKDCHNNLEHEAERSRAIKASLERNPHAFKPKIGVSTKGKSTADFERLHQKGCHCKKSNCLKNYCECYEAKVPCTDRCKCTSCRNTETDRNTKFRDKFTPSLSQLATTTGDRASSPFSDEESEAGQEAPDPKSFPWYYLTDDVIEATTMCLVAQAQEFENKVPSEDLEKSILKEFSRCLEQIIESASMSQNICMTENEIILSEQELLFFESALKLAERAYEENEVPVGCLLVFEGIIIGEGYNQVNKTGNPTRHGEFVAIDQAFEWCKNNGNDFKEVMRDTILYVNLEPCIMCASSVQQLCLKRMVFGACNPRFGGVKSVGNLQEYGHGHMVEVNYIPDVDNQRTIDLLRKFYDRENPFAPDDKRKIKNKQNDEIS
uniref:CRC domain-containing protein n=1 Tax=Acrobeloides nanus TaxID=290746 RepID=A0A914EDU5_9BILA